jgi:hypothetical protein
MTESLIHLRVPAALKGRWVRASRAAGLRLTDWIVNAVEAHMHRQLTHIAIPTDVRWEDLRLARDPDGNVSFDWGPIERICQACGVDVALFRDAPEDNLAQLLNTWYAAHRADGGEPCPIQEDLIAEALIEEQHGEHVSHQPCRA